MAIRTVQVDYQLPRRFNLEYVDSDNNKQTPVLFIELSVRLKGLLLF